MARRSCQALQNFNWSRDQLRNCNLPPRCSSCSSASERVATADLITLLAEFDRRQLYLAEGFSSLFRFCTEVLHLSEAAAYNRIQAARAARKWPVIIEQLRDGSVSLGVLGTLSPHLTDANHMALLREARHRGRRAVQLIVARLRPQRDVPSVIRKLPSPRPTEMLSTPLERPPTGRTCAQRRNRSCRRARSLPTRPRTSRCLQLCRHQVRLLLGLLLRLPPGQSLRLLLRNRRSSRRSRLNVTSCRSPSIAIRTRCCGRHKI